MQRTTFIIKPHLQIKYMFFTVMSVVLMSIFIYLTLCSSITNSSVYKHLGTSEQNSLWIAFFQNFGLILFVLILATGLESIFLFHRIFGPIYAFERVIKMIQNGDLTAQLHIRKTDELKDIGNEIQQMCGSLRETIKNDKAKIDSIQSKLDELINASDLPLIKTKLTEIKHTLGTLLEKFRI